LLAARPSRERERACAMEAARIIVPHAKLPTGRSWQAKRSKFTGRERHASVRKLAHGSAWPRKHRRGGFDVRQCGPVCHRGILLLLGRGDKYDWCDSMAWRVGVCVVVGRLRNAHGRSIGEDFGQ